MSGAFFMQWMLMVGLLYLKHAYDESDESVVADWVENQFWQF
jgi:IS5 family transposase